MANSSGVVGVLRALLTIDSAQFDTGMRKAAATSETATKQIGASLAKLTPHAERMAKAFGGDRLLASANNLVAAVTKIGGAAGIAGGAAKLTEAEQARVNRTVTEAIDKYRRLGQEAPAAMVKLQQATTKHTGLLETLKAKIGVLGPAIAAAFSVTAILAAGRRVVDYASHVADLSDRLRVSTTTVQEWEAAFGKSGVSIDVVSKASGELANKLIGGDKSAVAALEKLGFSINALKNMAPEDRLIAVGDAVGKIQNDAEALYASKTIFGKSGVELLAGLNGHLQETIDKLRAMGVVIGPELIQQADDFGDSLDVLQKVGLARVAQVLVPLLPGLSKLFEWVARLTSGTIGFAQSLEQWLIKGLMRATIVLFDWTIAIGEASRKIPLLGRFIGMSAATLDELKQSAQLGRDQLWSFSTAIDTTGIASTKARAPLLGLGDAAEKVEQKASAAEIALAAMRDRANEALMATQAALGKSLQTAKPATIDFGQFTSGVGAGILQNKGDNLIAPLIAWPKDIASEALDGSMVLGQNIADAFALMGLQTRDQLQRTADAARDAFDVMLASGLATADALAKAWEKSEAARQAAAGKTGRLSREELAATTAATVQSTADALQMLSQARTKSHALAVAAKLGAIGAAIMNTYEAATKALAKLPPPFSFIAAGATLAFGLAEVAVIKATPVGYAAGTPGLDFRNFGPRRAVDLHGEEAVIPLGGGHRLANEIATSLSRITMPSLRVPALPVLDIGAGGALPLAPASPRPERDRAVHVEMHISTIDASGVREFVESPAFLKSLGNAVERNTGFIATRFEKTLQR
jgi:hypothetical protein